MCCQNDCHGSKADLAICITLSNGQVAERAADVLAVLRQVQDEGAGSLRTIAAGLQAHGVLTPAGKAQWTATQVQRVQVRAAASELL